MGTAVWCPAKPARTRSGRCRRCGQPIRLTGEQWIGRAVHTATGSETGQDGHLVAPIDLEST